MKKKFQYIFIMVFILLVYSVPAQAVKFVLSPPRFEFTMPPGSSATEGVEISNQEDVPLQLRAYLEDWEMDTKGEIKYKKTGSLKNSCSNWVKVNPYNITLGPRESRLVRFTVTAPPGAAGSYWTMLFFESKPSASPKGQVGVMLTGRVGVIIYTMIPGTELRSGKILNMKIYKNKENKYNLALTFENTGNIHYRPQGSWVIKDEAGKRVRKGEIEEFLVLPKAIRIREFPLEAAGGPEALAPGKYTLSVELDYGAPDLVGGDLNFEIPGTTPTPAKQ